MSRPFDRSQVLPRKELLELEASIARSVEVLKAMVEDLRGAEATRALAREALGKAEANLARLRETLGFPRAGGEGGS